MARLSDEEKRQKLSLVKSVDEQMRSFLQYWHNREVAPRKSCPECFFETSEGYEQSHTPGCSLS